jgi:hypothetical protein
VAVIIYREEWEEGRGECTFCLWECVLKAKLREGKIKWDDVCATGNLKAFVFDGFGIL